MALFAVFHQSTTIIDPSTHPGKDGLPDQICIQVSIKMNSVRNILLLNWIHFGSSVNPIQENPTMVQQRNYLWCFLVLLLIHWTDSFYLCYYTFLTVPSWAHILLFSPERGCGYLPFSYYSRSCVAWNNEWICLWLDCELWSSEFIGTRCWMMKISSWFSFHYFRDPVVLHRTWILGK